MASTHQFEVSFKMLNSDLCHSIQLTARLSNTSIPLTIKKSVCSYKTNCFQAKVEFKTLEDAIKQLDVTKSHYKCKYEKRLRCNTEEVLPGHYFVSTTVSSGEKESARGVKVWRPTVTPGALMTDTTLTTVGDWRVGGFHDSSVRVDEQSYILWLATLKITNIIRSNSNGTKIEELE